MKQTPSGPNEDVARADLARETLARFDQLKMRATGGSMLPAIIPGDVLTFRAGAVACEHIGSVVLTIGNGRLIAHRLRGLAPDGWITRGDALESDDPVVIAGNMLGLLVHHERRGRELAKPGGTIAGLQARLSRWLIRHSRIAKAVLLRWHRFKDPAA